MTRNERLEFCKVCTNRKLEMSKGLICSLTGDLADFEGECESFERDETKEQVKASIILEEKEAQKARGKMEIIIGLALCGIGLILSVLPTGYIFWGAILVGTIYLIRGASKQ
jgi:hypothetical protein